MQKKLLHILFNIRQCSGSIWGFRSKGVTAHFFKETTEQFFKEITWGYACVWLPIYIATGVAPSVFPAAESTTLPTHLSRCIYILRTQVSSVAKENSWISLQFLAESQTAATNYRYTWQRGWWNKIEIATVKIYTKLVAFFVFRSRLFSEVQKPQPSWLIFSEKYTNGKLFQ